MHGGRLKSMEMLRLGKEAWESIDIPELITRTYPVLAQIDAKNICILGGK